MTATAFALSLPLAPLAPPAPLAPLAPLASLAQTPRTINSRISHHQPSHAFTILSQKPSSTPKPANSAPSSPIIPGTPCFTLNIMATPMPSTLRQAYLDAVAASLRAYLASLQSQPYPHRANITLLPPQLNPELDVYDRRFLLQLVWATLSVAASLSLRARVLIQGPSNFGAVPLSIAGLRRTFDADLALTIQDWPVQLRSGELENPDDVDTEDDLIFVVSPTNAVSIPVITSVEQLVQRVAQKPVILINPRLYDVPSHSGVMQVSGRAHRINFLQTFQDIFYMKLLFKAGTGYPLRGILYHAYPDPWQVWRALDNTTCYNLILSSENYPDSELINKAFSRDAYQRQKQRLQQSKSEGTVPALDVLLNSPQLVVFILVVSLLAAAALVDSGNLQLILHSVSDPVPK